jgi:hypothetical protein
VLRYLRNSLAGHAKFRDADEQDQIDMPVEVLEQWRETHPFDTIPITNTSKTNMKAGVVDKAKKEIDIRVAAYTENNARCSSYASTAAVPVPQARSQQAVGTISLGVPVQRTRSQKQRDWEEENRKTDMDSSNILTTNRRSGT